MGLETVLQPADTGCFDWCGSMFSKFPLKVDEHCANMQCQECAFCSDKAKSSRQSEQRSKLAHGMQLNVKAVKAAKHEADIAQKVPPPLPSPPLPSPPHSV